MNYLLQISVGPVQDFIAAARRTRDLWFGSMLLGEIARAVAKSVQSNGGKLIFPAASNEKELGELTGISNIILAEIQNSDSEKLKSISDKAKAAAKNELKNYADKVFKKMSKWIVEDRYYAQIDDSIEFYSAWVPLGENYSEARKNVANLLSARKNIRDFSPNKSAKRVHKSSLDGLRESVFNDKPLENIPDDVKLQSKESLDAIGLIKRVPTDDKKFQSIGRVVLKNWGRGKGKKFMRDFEDNNIISSDDEFQSISWYIDDENYSPDAPYVAFICADGDKMGEALSKMQDVSDHRKFSSDLAGFAVEARKIIKEHTGECIYTGGDDVIAYVAVDKALECARSLHDKFGEIMGKYNASLSVGVSIAHAKELLSQLLDFAREAERIAKKPNRDGLAVSVRSRRNIPFTIREQWKAKNQAERLAELSLDQRVEWFASYFRKKEIPTKFPYELRKNEKFYNNWKNEEDLKTAIINDVTRIFSRKDITLNDDERHKIGEYIQAKIKNADTLGEFADELILAEWIGAAKFEEGDENEIQNNAD